MTVRELYQKHENNIDFIRGGLELLYRADDDSHGGEGLFWPVIGEIQARFNKVVEDIENKEGESSCQA